MIVDPDPNKIYTKRKARECSISLPRSSSHTKEVTEINYPTTGWGRNLEKLPLFTKAEMKKHVENSGKRVGSVEHHSVPTSLKRAKTFLQDEYLFIYLLFIYYNLMATTKYKNKIYKYIYMP